MTVTIGRRELLIALGGTAAWPLAGARAAVSDKHTSGRMVGNWLSRRLSIFPRCVSRWPEGSELH